MATLVLVPVAAAARPPSLAEREAITLALPKYFRDAPVECIWIDIRVSRDPRFAKAGADMLNLRRPRCARYAHNGFWILKKKAGTWRRIYSGSDWPPCPMRIPRDLGPCSTG
jgi:hypothetical protein